MAEGPQDKFEAAIASDRKTTDIIPTFELAFPVLLDNLYLGDVSVLIKGDVKSFASDRLIALLKPELTQDILSSFESSAIDGRLTIGQIDVSGLIIEFNDQLQQIEINSGISAREVRVLTVDSQPVKTKTALEKPANFSLFITPSVTAEYAWNESGGADKGLQDFLGTLDIGGRIGGETGIAFLSRQSYTIGNNGNNSEILREETQLIYDNLGKLFRITAGDLRPRGASFQSIPGIGGVSIERFFELEPNRIFRPLAQTNFQLERPSTVEVRINGVTQREFFLQPGRYDLEDLPLVQGSNLVDLVIRDDTGREQVISDRNFFDFDLLEKGITDFSFAGGVKSRFNQNSIQYSDDPIVSAFARRGWSGSLTAGVDVQADAQGANGGGSLLWASPIGIWRLEGSASSRKSYGTGFAGDIGYRNSGYIGKNNDWKWDLNADARYVGERFATVNDTILNQISTNTLTGTPDTSSLQPIAATFNASIRLIEKRVSISGASSYSVGRGFRPDTYSFIGGLNYALSSNLNAGIFGRFLDDGVRRETGASLQLTWRPSRNMDVTTRYDTARNEGNFRFRRSAPRAVGQLSYGLNAFGDFDSQNYNISADAFYTANRFETTARHNILRPTNSGSDYQQNSRLTVASSFVMADGTMGFGRPVRETFAILSPHSSLPKNQIYVDPTDDTVSAKTDFLGPAVAVDISPFSSRAIYVDVQNLPPGYDLGTGEFALRPPQFSGYNLTVGSGESFTLIGQVNIAGTGEPLVYMGGQLKSIDNPAAEPVLAFTNRNGRLAASGLKPGRYRLSLFTNPIYTQDIIVPDDGPNLLNIGRIDVTLK